MAVVYLIRRERFCSAHKLSKPEWSAEKNLKVFGKCSNENWHGHNYQLFVTVKGEPDPETGMVIDLKLLKRLINEHVIEDLDHRNINMDVPWMHGKMASVENLAIGIWERLKTVIAQHGADLHKVRVYETENNIIDYYGS